MRSYALLFACFILSACTTVNQTNTSLPAPLVDSDPNDEITPIKSLSQVEPFLAGLPKGQTLVIFDIDDTLLTADHPAFYGSDLWYNWRKDDPTFKCMSDVLALNYQAASQKATEEAAGPALLNGMTYDKMMLTSRSPNYRSATERELLEADYKPLHNVPGTPVEMRHGTAFRHPDAPNKRNRNLVTYANGIFMTEGGNKGDMLLYLFQHLKIEGFYQNIVLVDDTWSKQTDMRTALKGQPYRFYGLHYRGVKDDTDPDWLKLQPWQLKEAKRHERAFRRELVRHYPDFASRCMTPDYQM
ncbi:DUF2608 domain-containing protein [Pseudoxanthomonas mexicana]